MESERKICLSIQCCLFLDLFAQKHMQTIDLMSIFD